MRWFKNALTTTLAVLLILAIYGLVAYRDIGRAELRARYGNDTLHVIEVDGTELAYRKTGTGPPIVMVHSMFFHMGMWDDWAADLARDFTVYRYDLAGHGLSGPAAGADYSLDASVARLNGFMDAMGLDRVRLVGSSAGGAIAFNFAARHPARVERLILNNSGGLDGVDSAGRGGAPDWAYWILRMMPDTALDGFVRWTMAEREPSEAFLSEFRDMWRGAGNRRGILGRMQQFRSPDTRRALGWIKAPTLIQWGADNPQLPVEQAAAFAALMDAATPVQVKVYDGFGHVLPAEGSRHALADARHFFSGGATDK